MGEFTLRPRIEGSGPARRRVVNSNVSSKVKVLEGDAKVPHLIQCPALEDLLEPFAVHILTVDLQDQLLIFAAKISRRFRVSDRLQDEKESRCSSSNVG